MSSEYEEGAAENKMKRKDDSLKEYREKEAMSPAKDMNLQQWIEK
jgi:predicted DNA-binding protein (MmcQ/YjbR family)